MSSAETGARAAGSGFPSRPTGVVRPSDVEDWFRDLGLKPAERADREEIASWDLVLDRRRRFDLRITVILDPALGVICWAHYAPPISDMFRKSYRKLLRWNDEFPFAKFSVSEDERPLLAVELPIELAGADQLGLALARILDVADRLLDESAHWIWPGGRVPEPPDRAPASAALLDRYADRLPAPMDAPEE